MPTPENGQKNSSNLLAVADKIFEGVWPFLGVGAEMVRSVFNKSHIHYYRETLMFI